MDINKIHGEQYCMNCSHWKRKVNGRIGCNHSESKACWFANQLNGCDYFEGELQPKRDWSKADIIGYRPSTFSK